MAHHIRYWITKVSLKSFRITFFLVFLDLPLSIFLCITTSWTKFFSDASWGLHYMWQNPIVSQIVFMNLIVNWRHSQLSLLGIFIKVFDDIYNKLIYLFSAGSRSKLTGINVVHNLAFKFTTITKYTREVPPFQPSSSNLTGYI